jgi:hypothetical protein
MHQDGACAVFKKMTMYVTSFEVLGVEKVICMYVSEGTKCKMF